MQGIFAAEVIPDCGVGTFCPNGAITRKEMAKFLLLAKNGASYSPPACTTATFSDVPCSNPYAAWIYEIAREGITSGCAAGVFCPDGTVTRSQMSVFLMVARGYPAAACPPSSFLDVPTSSPVLRLDQPGGGEGDHRRLRRRQLLPGEPGAARPDVGVPGDHVRDPDPQRWGREAASPCREAPLGGRPASLA